VAKLSARQLRELEDPATWEAAGEAHPAVASPRAVVSVAFPREEFGRVAEAARARGMTLSAFIREAALERAKRGSGRSGPAVAMVSATQSGFIESSFTTAAVVRVETDEKAPFVTVTA